MKSANIKKHTQHFRNSLSILLGIFILSGCGSPSAQTQALENACLDKMSTALSALDNAENNRSLKLDPNGGSVRAGNASIFLRGDPDRVVFILHGYLGSPYEIRPLADALYSQGYTVVAPLLAGFGRSTLAAAGTGSTEWLSTTQQQIEAAELCGKNIQVIGFSLGALIETKILLDHLEVRSKVASLTLLSPALKIRDHSLLSVTSTIFRVLNSTPSITFLASAARKMGNHDLDILEAHPEVYNSEMPLVNVKELTRLSASVDYTQFATFTLPIKIIYSESDHTVDGFTASSMVAQYLPSLATYAFPATANVNHQILLSDVPDAVNQAISEVLKNFK